MPKRLELTTVPEECQEAVDEAATLRQELDSLLLELSAFENRLRNVDEGGPTAFRNGIADELHEILHPSTDGR